MGRRSIRRNPDSAGMREMARPTRWRYPACSATIVTREGADACDAQARERTAVDLEVYNRIP